MDVKQPDERTSVPCQLVKLPNGGRILLLSELILYLGLVEENQEHHHYVMQLSFAPDAPVKIVSEEQLHESPGIVLTGPNVPHQLQGQGKPQLLLFLDSVSALGRALRYHVLAGQPVCSLDKAEVQQAAQELAAAAAEHFDPDEVVAAVDTLLKTILPETASAPALDPRVARVLACIDLDEESTLSIKTLADLVAVSESRLMHLFKAEVGVPLRQYLLFRRLLRAIHLLLGQRLNFTQAAHAAGFADAAHFTRTFRQMIGFTPFSVFKA